MLLESTGFWLTVFYVFVACAIGFVLLVYRWLNRSTFRFENGESIGVGYEEDATGHVIGSQPGPDIVDGDVVHPPHISVTQH